MAAVAVVPAFLLAGCTKTIDNSGAEKLIRSSIDSAGKAKVKSVSCPSDVTAKAGGSFDCKLTVTAPDGSEHSGTVTIHMLDSNGHVQAGQSDYHLQ
jgi:VCBS repeat-containing protein